MDQKPGNKKLDVSIIIVNWNTAKLLHDCIQSIYDNTTKLLYEVIVVDNASTDGSVEMIKKLFPCVRLIENEKNLGYAAGVNRGIIQATARYCLILNSDILFCENDLHKIVKFADDNPDAGMFGCKVYQDHHRLQLTCFRFPSLINLMFDSFFLNRLFPKSRLFNREFMPEWKRDTVKSVDVISGMFMLVRSRAITQVGLMDEDYFLLCEETDWCWRFEKADWKRVFYPYAKVIHLDGGGKSREKANLKMMVQFRKSMLIYFRKHKSLPEYLIARLLLAVQAGIGFIGYAILNILKFFTFRKRTYEISKIRGFWATFKFCLMGMEPKG